MKYVTTINKKKFEIEIDKEGKVLVNGQPRDVDFLPLGRSFYSILMNNLSHEVVVEERDEAIEVLLHGRLYNGQVLDERALLMAQRTGGLPGEGGDASIKSPMPGLIVSVRVEVGEAIKAGQTVVILESMKMQNELKSPRDGIVQKVNVGPGQSVEQNKILVTIGEPAEGGESQG